MRTRHPRRRRAHPHLLPPPFSRERGDFSPRKAGRGGGRAETGGKGRGRNTRHATARHGGRILSNLTKSGGGGVRHDRLLEECGSRNGKRRRRRRRGRGRRGRGRRPGLPTAQPGTLAPGPRPGPSKFFGVRQSFWGASKPFSSRFPPTKGAAREETASKFSSKFRD